MIQRIQTIYLLLLIGAFTSLFFIPLSSVSGSGSDADQLHILRVHSESVYKGDQVMETHPVTWLVIVSAIILLLSLITIFLYKKRKIQMLMCKLIMVAVIIFVMLAFRETDRIAAAAGTNAIYQAGAYLVVVSFLFIYLALNGIRKDEELIRSSDRLR